MWLLIDVNDGQRTWASTLPLDHKERIEGLLVASRMGLCPCIRYDLKPEGTPWVALPEDIRAATGDRPARA